MAISPSKPDRIDITRRGKAYVWLAPTISAGGDTINVSGIKEVWNVSVGNRPGTTFTYTNTGSGGVGSGGTVVLTVTVTASCTGPANGTGPTILYVEGHD